MVATKEGGISMKVFISKENQKNIFNALVAGENEGVCRSGLIRGRIDATNSDIEIFDVYVPEQVSGFDDAIISEEVMHKSVADIFRESGPDVIRSYCGFAFYSPNEDLSESDRNKRARAILQRIISFNGYFPVAVNLTFNRNGECKIYYD